MSEFEGERIAKVIARAGVCSRREAEQLILDGHVTLNHKILKTAAMNVTAADQIRINGKLLPQKEETKLWRYHKPDGLVVSHKDPEGRLQFQHPWPAWQGLHHPSCHRRALYSA